MRISMLLLKTNELSRVCVWQAIVRISCACVRACEIQLTVAYLAMLKLCIAVNDPAFLLIHRWYEWHKSGVWRLLGQVYIYPFLIGYQSFGLFIIHGCWQTTLENGSSNGSETHIQHRSATPTGDKNINININSNNTYTRGVIADVLNEVKQSGINVANIQIYINCDIQNHQTVSCCIRSWQHFIVFTFIQL